MKIIKVIKYYKHIRRGEEPAKYTAHQKGNKVDIIIRLDPILKKHSDLRKAIIKHELDETRNWAKKKLASHQYAKNREPEFIKKIGGVSGFWDEIKRREK